MKATGGKGSPAHAVIAVGPNHEVAVEFDLFAVLGEVNHRGVAVGARRETRAPLRAHVAASLST